MTAEQKLLVEVTHTKQNAETGEFEPEILTFVALDNEDFSINKTLLQFTEADTGRAMIFPSHTFICAHQLVEAGLKE